MLATLGDRQAPGWVAGVVTGPSRNLETAWSGCKGSWHSLAAAPPAAPPLIVRFYHGSQHRSIDGFARYRDARHRCRNLPARPWSPDLFWCPQLVRSTARRYPDRAREHAHLLPSRFDAPAVGAPEP